MANKPQKPTSNKKTPVKKRTRKKSSGTSNLKKNTLIVFAVLLVISLVSFGYFLGKNDTRETPLKSGEYVESYSTKQLLTDLSKIKIQKQQEVKAEEIVYKEVTKVEKKTSAKDLFDERGMETKVKEIAETQTEVKAKKKQNISLAYRGKKPKLVIIIDDVSSAAQMKRIKDLGMKITPSIFPPSELSMSSHTLAKGTKNYMIHLPMESGSKQFNKQYKTLITTFSKEQISTRVKELRKLFPNAKYVNNHTGSVFTDDYTAMHTLYKALKEEGFVFVDSRTIGSTKVRKIAHEFGDAYVARDIFIDNEHKVPYIHKQLKQAVKTAKKKGYAVAIGHPHKVTMKALKSAAHILKDVELVYIDAIYKRI